VDRRQARSLRIHSAFTERYAAPVLEDEVVLKSTSSTLARTTPAVDRQRETMTYPPQQHPGYPAAEPKKKTGLIITLIIVAILILGGGSAALYLFALTTDGDDPRAVADDYVVELGIVTSATAEDADLAPLKPLACAKDFKNLSDLLETAKKQPDGKNKESSKKTFAVTNFAANGQNATFDMTVTAEGTETDPDDKLAMTVEKEDDHLVVCGFTDGARAPSGDTADDGDPMIPRPTKR
jgi:hypothetical protein